MVRHSNQPARDGGVRSPRQDAVRLPRPVSTGHLLADCERWCRDHLPRRHRADTQLPDRRRPRT